jgi:hypothetical protein
MPTALELLLAALATTVSMMGLAANSATAQIHVEREPAGDCDPCVVHGVSTQSANHPFSELEVNVPGHVIVSGCVVEFEGEIHEDGVGHIYSQSLSDPPGLPGVCLRQPCDSASEEEWPFALSESGPGAEALSFRFCIEPIGGGTESHCDLVRTIDGRTHDHLSEAAAVACQNDPSVVISSEWELEMGGESHDAIEIIHAP